MNENVVQVVQEGLELTAVGRSLPKALQHLRGVSSRIEMLSVR